MKTVKCRALSSSLLFCFAFFSFYFFFHLFSVAISLLSLPSKLSLIAF